MWTPAARAERIKVVVLDIVIAGDAPPQLRRLMLRSLISGLRAAKYDVLDRREVRRKLRGARELTACVTSTCLQRMAVLVDAQHFVWVRIEAQGAAYNFEITLLSTEATNGLVNKVEASCAVCTLVEANQTMRNTAIRLAEPPQAKTVHVVITTDPAGATVYVDGKEQGPSPANVELTEGNHTFRATHTDMFDPAETSTVVTAPADGQSVPVSLTLTRKPPPASPSGPHFGGWKYAPLGGGVAAVGAGVTLLWLDGRSVGTCRNSGTLRTCSKIYDTKLPAFGALGAGVVLTGFAIYMFIADTPQPKTTVSVVPTESGGAVLVHGRF